MTVQASIPRPHGCERAFALQDERRAAIDLVKAMWRTFYASPALYVVVVNLSRPPIDALIVTESGLGMLEFKDDGGRIWGKRYGKWRYRDAQEKSRVVIAGSRHKNPYEQVGAHLARKAPTIPLSMESESTLRRGTSYSPRTRSCSGRLRTRRTSTRDVARAR